MNISVCLRERDREKESGECERLRERENKKNNEGKNEPYNIFLQFSLKKATYVRRGVQ